MKRIYLLLACTILLSSVYSQPDLAVSSFATGFDMPTSIKHAGDSRLFVTEQDGVIKIVNMDGSVNVTPFLDIQAIVINNFGIGDERGLLGLAFHPDYSSNGYFYVNYINNSGNTVVSRFSRHISDLDLADSSSELIILTFNQPFFNHNGGDLAFGSDGYLYISSGDGGDQNDPSNYGQSLNTFLGKILRIDVDGGSPYAIPAGNPFASDGNPNTFDEIWAYGLRNPWRFSFDRQTDDIWIADVGQNNIEEINMAASNEDGLNYGWRCYEGNVSFNSSGCPPDNTLTFPVEDYAHSGEGAFKCSITGGYRYRGLDYPNFSGLYFFADYCSGEVGYLEYNGSTWDMTLNTVNLGNSWSAFGEDQNGELYLADLDSGVIYELIDNNLSVTEFEQNAFKMYPNPTRNELNFEFNSIPDKIILYEIQGKLINEFLEITNNLFSVSTSKLSLGMYIVEVHNGNGSKSIKKLIVR